MIAWKTKVVIKDDTYVELDQTDKEMQKLLLDFRRVDSSIIAICDNNTGDAFFIPSGNILFIQATKVVAT